MIVTFANHIRFTIEEQRQLHKSFGKDLTVQAHSTTVDHDDAIPDDRTGQTGNLTRRGAFPISTKKVSRQFIDIAEAGDLGEIRRCIAKNADVNH